MFFTENKFWKLLCKPKYRVTTKQKNHVADRMECINCQSACFSKSKHMKSRSKEHMRSGKNCDLEKNEIDKHFWLEDHKLLLISKVDCRHYILYGKS